MLQVAVNGIFDNMTVEMNDKCKILGTVNMGFQGEPPIARQFECRDTDNLLGIIFQVIFFDIAVLSHLPIKIINFVSAAHQGLRRRFQLPRHFAPLHLRIDHSSLGAVLGPFPARQETHCSLRPKTHSQGALRFIPRPEELPETRGRQLLHCRHDIDPHGVRARDREPTDCPASDEPVRWALSGIDPESVPGGAAGPIRTRG